MKIKLIFITYFLLTFIFFSCNRSKSEGVTNITNSAEEVIKSKVDLLRDITPLFEDGDVNAVIEIPSGTIEKWELNKSTGQVQWELVDNTQRVVNYLGYPGTMGSACYDYIIADEIVLPKSENKNYVENIIHLPECYQPNQAKIEKIDQIFDIDILHINNIFCLYKSNFIWRENKIFNYIKCYTNIDESNYNASLFANSSLSERH